MSYLLLLALGVAGATLACYVLVLGVERARVSLLKFGAVIFGRSSDPNARVDDVGGTANAIVASPDQDDVVKQLRTWKPHAAYQLGGWPEWQQLWPRHSQPHSVVGEHAVESLFRYRPLPDYEPPYELLRQPPSFEPDPLRLEPPAPPPEPDLLDESWAPPVLVLPLWKWPLSFLNVFVRTAHQETVARYETLATRAKSANNAAHDTNKARRVAWKDAMCRFDAARAKLLKYQRQTIEGWTTAKASFEKAREADLSLLRNAYELLETSSAEGVVAHFDLVLRRLLLPSFVPRQWALKYVPETRTLLIEHQFPDTANLQIARSESFGKSGPPKPVSQKRHRELVPRVQPALCLQLAHVIARADFMNKLDYVAVNGWVEFHSRTTGHLQRAYCASLVAHKSELIALRLETADMVSAFNALKGAYVGDAYESGSITPSLRMQTDDPRFVPGREVLGKLASDQNLACMEWEDFEHLIRELFEREFASNGSEVKVTRASRDKGVDAVVFDPDPLRGGKLVIQAKRYTIPVDVSAVRDLYGTVLNEGANLGILVTTSHFGGDAYAFVQNKPLRLINGAQLLGLLEKSGYKFRIDIDEARRMSDAERDQFGRSSRSAHD